MKTIIYRLICQIYATILRPILVEKIDDPNSDHDEDLLTVIDAVFQYK